MSLPQQLSHDMLDELTTRVGAKELHGDDGGPLLTLRNELSGGTDRIGELRVFTSDAAPKIVYCGITVEQFAMDTHMIFGFGSAETGVPHFTLDSVNANGTLAFHLDLVPRAELATHVPYMDHIFGGLTDTYTETSKWDGLTKAHITPRQYAMMSPWMLVNRADEDAFKAIAGPVRAYLDHWIGLAESGIPDDIAASLADVDLPDHDRKLRANLFSPEVDPVWGNIGKIIGEDAAIAVRGHLASNDF